MGHVRVTKAGYLYFDFFYNGHRCKEYTELKNTPENLKVMTTALEKIDSEIRLGTFEYSKYFPGKNRAQRPSGGVAASGQSIRQNSFTQFAWKWYKASKVEWKNSTRGDFLSIVEGHLIPYFKETDVSTIKKMDLKEFRTTLSQKKGRKGHRMSNKRINNIMVVLRLILEEALEELDLPSPFKKLSPLPVVKDEIHPFSLDEVNTFLKGVRSDFLNYYKVRFFTGMRTAEIDGLKWKYIDFETKKILIRETWERAKWDTPKTDNSIRNIDMSKIVESALRAQRKVSGHLEIVFANRAGRPLDHNLVTKRVWYPTLTKLKLPTRVPYQTRHTTATFWLASGENPEWISRQMGHSNTEMLFKTYSKVIPNLTRQDGSAFERFSSKISDETSDCGIDNG